MACWRAYSRMSGASAQRCCRRAEQSVASAGATSPPRPKCRVVSRQRDVVLSCAAAACFVCAAVCHVAAILRQFTPRVVRRRYADISAIWFVPYERAAKHATAVVVLPPPYMPERALLIGAAFVTLKSPSRPSVVLQQCTRRTQARAGKDMRKIRQMLRASNARSARAAHEEAAAGSCRYCRTPRAAAMRMPDARCSAQQQHYYLRARAGRHGSSNTPHGHVTRRVAMREDMPTPMPSRYALLRKTFARSGGAEFAARRRRALLRANIIRCLI